MKKKELLALTPPEMGTHLREIARKDEPQRVSQWVSTKKYQYGRYLLAKEENGYLIVSVFLAEHVRAEARYPAYVVYFDRKADEFITWETDTGKWRNSMLDHLDWPEYMYDSGNYVSREDAELIQGYLGVQSETYEDLLQFQRDVRMRSLLARDKKKTDAWDEAMKPVPALPKDWKTWILKQAVREHYIFYQYQRGGATEGYCTHCGQTVRIRNRDTTSRVSAADAGRRSGLSR